MIFLKPSVIFGYRGRTFITLIWKTLITKNERLILNITKRYASERFPPSHESQKNVLDWLWFWPIHYSKRKKIVILKFVHESSTCKIYHQREKMFLCVSDDLKKLGQMPIPIHVFFTVHRERIFTNISYHSIWIAWRLLTSGSYKLVITGRKTITCRKMHASQNQPHITT